MRISIVTPSFNQGSFLEETIRTILDQQYPDLEYMVMDGGSTDESVDIIRRYADRIAYWVSEKDEGQAHAIQKGLERSSGEIFAWQNSDDRYLPGTLAYVAGVFEAHPEVDILFGRWNFIDRNGELVSERGFDRMTLRTLRSGLHCPPQPAVFLRRSAVERVGGLNVSRQQVMDYDLYIRIAGIDNLFVSQRVLGDFRLHGDSKTISQFAVQFREMKTTRRERLSGTAGITERLFWHLSDAYIALREWVHVKLGVFSLRSGIRNEQAVG